MALRHQLAVSAVNVTNVFNLCEILKAAAQDAVTENVFPNRCPACRLIAHQIAFVCNGDVTLHDRWDEAYEYCSKMMEIDVQGGLTKGEKPDEPAVLPS